MPSLSRPLACLAARLTCCVAFAAAGLSNAAHFKPYRCEILPLPGHQVSFRIDGSEKLRWHFDEKYPRPFFFPFNGPSGESLTRMGHPGAENHDHHRSVWFAHAEVDGFNFWADPRHAKQPGTVRQKHWLAYEEGDTEAIMAAQLGWYDDKGKELMEQDLVAALIPLANGEHALEIQVSMRPPNGADKVELGKTNFGFLAVRVAKSLSVHFGGGEIHNSERQKGESEIFAKPARWMDYSGPLFVGTGAKREVVTEGITYFDHPSNPRHPAKWHVREDGWMGASFCMDEGMTLTKDKPLTLRYLLHAHSGIYDPANAATNFEAFSARPGFEITKSQRKHRQFDVQRMEKRAAK